MSFLLLSALIASGCGDGIDVRKKADGAFDIEAKGASIARVIECLSGVADFKVVVDPGFTMGDVVSMNASARNSADAIRVILDGQGLNYAFTTDPQGSKVLMLMISGRAAKAAPASEPPPLIRSVPPARPGLPRPTPPTPTTEPEPASEPMVFEPPPPRGQAPALRPRGTAPSVVPPAEVPLYPDPRPLTPLTQSDARRSSAARSGVGARR